MCVLAPEIQGTWRSLDPAGASIQVPPQPTGNDVMSPHKMPALLPSWAVNSVHQCRSRLDTDSDGKLLTPSCCFDDLLFLWASPNAGRGLAQGIDVRLVAEHLVQVPLAVPRLLSL
jgi:hypothetical protein